MLNHGYPIIFIITIHIRRLFLLYKSIIVEIKASIKISRKWPPRTIFHHHHSTFSNDGHVFWLLKNFNWSVCEGNTKKNTSTFIKFCCNWFQRVIHIKMTKKSVSGAITPTTGNKSFRNFWQRSIFWWWTKLPVLFIINLQNSTNLDLSAKNCISTICSSFSKSCPVFFVFFS